MLPKNISSLQHPFVKYLVKLRKNRYFRREEKKVVILGRTIVEELSHKDPSPIELLLLKEGTSFTTSYPILTVTEEILQKITGTQHPEPVAAIAQIPSFTDISLASSSYLLVLDGVADPGNLGTLLRTALALGWEGVYITENSCDPFNDKALRAAKGATFQIPLQEGSWDTFLELAASRQVFVADLHGLSPHQITPTPPLALVLSRETTGARKNTPSFFTRVTLPMTDVMESLNVASAGSILLYELRGKSL